ncbi:MAG: hypothetical protein JW763_00730 [candidate division Zixibacteria bacterium]|nr:hypothetical protein [candidate division Zixibacteria bacterium]
MHCPKCEQDGRENPLHHHWNNIYKCSNGHVFALKVSPTPDGQVYTMVLIDPDSPDQEWTVDISGE